jgi:hypothetical protein
MFRFRQLYEILKYIKETEVLLLAFENYLSNSPKSCTVCRDTLLLY